MSYFRGKKVLVAGASGLTGRNLFEFLKQQGDDVIGTCFANMNKELYCVDFTCARQTERFFYEFKFDYVFICCAQSYNADVCKHNPEALILPNITMVSNILSACLKRHVSKVMYMSSATVYQPSKEALLEEELDLNQAPHVLYMGIGWAKRYIEKLCDFYSSLGLMTLVVRPTNIYGKYDKTNLDLCHVVPAFIMRLLSGENPFIVSTRGDGVKNFIYVDDLVRDMLQIMLECKISNTFNLTSDEYFSIKEVVLLCVKEINPSCKVLFDVVSDAVHFVGLYRNKFDLFFGHNKYVTFESGIKEVIAWYSSLPQTQRK
jgi:GDP-L-fucose synthase